MRRYKTLISAFLLLSMILTLIMAPACGKVEVKTPSTSVPSTATTIPMIVVSGSPYPPPEDASTMSRPELIGEDWYFDVPADDSGKIIVGYDYNSHCITSYDPVSGLKQELIHVGANRGIVGKPSVYGDKVAYITGHFDCQGICVSTSSATWPSPTSDFIISVFDMTTGEIKKLTTDNHYKTYPIIYGDTIVWLDCRDSEESLNGQSALYKYDLKTGLEKKLTNISSNIDESLLFNGDWVVWKEKRYIDTNTTYDIYAYDLKHNKEKRLTSASSSSFLGNLCMSGDFVVWQDDRNVNPDSFANGVIKYDYTYNQDIYMYDLAQGKEKQITSYSGKDHDPAINGHHIVWVRDTGDRKGDVFTYDINTGQETQVSHTGNALYNSPTVKGDLVLWADSTPKNTGYGSPTVSSLSLYDLNTARLISVPLPDQVWDSWGTFNCQPTIIDKSNVLYTLGNQGGLTWVYAVHTDPGEFGIYAVTHRMTWDQISQTSLEDFDLMEKPVISIDDIVSYDPKTYEIELSQWGLSNFNNAFGVQAGQPFVICIGKERIYSGLFWSAAFSLAISGVKIYVSPPDDKLMSPTISLDFWRLTNEADPRTNDMTIRAFAHAGKLK